MRILTLFLLPFLISCTIARMDMHGALSSNGTLGNTEPGPEPAPVPAPTPVPNRATETFTASAQQRKVDILFVDDNSASMDPLQASLGSRFPSFSTAVQDLDWQIGITTTDCSNGPWGICGSLVPMTGTTDYILTASVPNYQQVFNNTIVRAETIGCVARGSCPSGNSEPLKAAMTSFDKRNTDNARFFRDGVPLAIIILTNADEMNSGPPQATQPQTVINRFRTIWGNSKDLKVYAINVIPNDTACRAQMEAQSIGQVFYGVGPSTLATLTGGFPSSICAPNYNPLLQQIGGDIQGVPNVITLARTPLPGTLQIAMTPASTATWVLNGNTVTFSRSLPGGTVITISYEY